ncbi:MAG: alpha/beta hydrolase, partial [Myxococcales bacterium]|nr:alpha/beta hydrolase [Myxococcales bacterium]
RSPEPPASFGYTVDDQVAFVDALLAEAGVTEPVTVVVHDIGGMMGVPWVARNLARVRGLMITNTVAFEGFKWFGIARRWGDASFTGRLRSALMMWAIGLRGGAPFKRAFGQQNPQLDPAELDRITRTFALNTAAKNASLRQFRELLRGDFFSGFDAMNEAITAAVPTRVLWGDGDPYVATQYAQRFARAKATVLPGVGHWVPMVAADRLADEIRALVGVPG